MYDAEKPAPQWVPAAVADHIRKLSSQQKQSPDKLVILNRLLFDSRMKEIWDTLLERDRATGHYRYLVRNVGVSIPDEKQNQEHGCALLIHILFEMTASRQVQLRQMDIETECQRLRQSADQMRATIGVAGPHGILSEHISVFGQASLHERDRQTALLSRLNLSPTLTGEGQSFADLGYSHPEHGSDWYANGGQYSVDYSAMLTELARRLEAKADEISKDWEGHSSAKNVGNMQFKFIAAALCQTFEKYFGQSLNGTAANLAAVALGLRVVNVATARKAEQRRRKPQ